MRSDVFESALSNPLKLDELIHAGLTANLIEDLAQGLGLTGVEVATLCGVSRATFYRKQKNKEAEQQ